MLWVKDSVWNCGGTKTVPKWERSPSTLTLWGCGHSRTCFGCYSNANNKHWYLSTLPAVIAQRTQIANRICDFSGALLSEAHCDPVGLGGRTVWSMPSILASPAEEAIKSFRQSLIVLLQKFPLKKKKEVRLNKGERFFSMLLRKPNICLDSWIGL